VRNQADNMIHAVTKSLKEAGDKISADERQAIEKSVESLKEAVKGNDKELIESKTKELTDASAKMAEKMYANQPGGAEAGPQQPGEKTEQKNDNVVDAEFEEVKNDDKK
jgi:molecular chaperone DnaK